MPQLLLDVALCLDDKIQEERKTYMCYLLQINKRIRLIREPCDLVTSTPYLCTRYYVCSYSWILTWEIQLGNN